MKLAKIRYRVLIDGRIKIVDWEDIALRREIFEENKSVGNVYFGDIPHFCKTTFAGKETISIWVGHHFVFSRGKVVQKETFEELIKTMKQAGKRLSRIIAHEKVAEIKEIVI